MGKNKSIKKSFKSRKFKMGGFQTAMMVVVIAIVVVLNLIVGKMNVTVDLSSDKLYSLTDQTKNLVAGLDKDITIYYLVQDNNEVTQVEKVLDEYEKLSHVTVEKKDPVIYPTFASEYTDEEVSENSVIVSNEADKRSRYIPYTDLLVSDMQSYYQTGETSYTLDAEGQITAGIQSVTSKDTNKVYMTTGHGEQPIGTEFANVLKKTNYDQASMDENVKEIPDDCDILIMYGAQYDISDDEYKVYSDYMENGGKLMIYISVASNTGLVSTPNLDKLMKDYGIVRVPGFIMDDSPDGSGMNTEIMPEVESHDITADIGDKIVYMPATAGFTTDAKVRSTLETDTLLKSSDKSFARTSTTESSTDKTSSDVSGPFSLAVAATDTYTAGADNPGARMVVYGSYAIATDSFISTDQYGDRSLLTHSLSWLTGTKTSSLAIPTRSLDETRVELPAVNRIFWTVLLVGVVPIVLLVIGVIIWYKRRKS